MSIKGAVLYASRDVRLHGGPASVRRFLPEVTDLVWKRQI